MVFFSSNQRTETNHATPLLSSRCSFSPLIFATTPTAIQTLNSPRLPRSLALQLPSEVEGVCHSFGTFSFLLLVGSEKEIQILLLGISRVVFLLLEDLPLDKKEACFWNVHLWTTGKLKLLNSFESWNLDPNRGPSSRSYLKNITIYAIKTLFLARQAPIAI